MATVWVLSTGEYSDCRDVGVFSTKERALDAMASRMNRMDNDPEEFELDAIPGARRESRYSRGPVYACSIRIDNGTIYPEDQMDWYRDVAATKVEAMGVLSDPHMIRVESPASAEHAEKVAIEKRQEFMRTGNVAGMTEHRYG